MLRRLSLLRGIAIQAKDSEIGTIRDAYFDDQQWTIRYFVADTGTWLPGRKVLLSPAAVRSVAPAGERILFDLTRQQIENSPSVDEHQPVSRQHEIDVVGYYGWPAYWGAPAQPMYETPQMAATKAQDAHLRSCSEVINYTIHAQDGDLGHVEDFLLDDETWDIRYIAIDTRNWWPGKKVLIAPDWIREIDWASMTVDVDHSRDEIRNSPEFDPNRPIARDYEDQLHRHYGRPGYWR